MNILTSLNIIEQFDNNTLISNNTLKVEVKKYEDNQQVHSIKILQRTLDIDIYKPYNSIDYK